MDTLPTELIQRIIGFLPVDSALALSRVNRALYEVCNHPLVFKSIIDNRNGPGDERLLEFKAEWPPGLSPEDSVNLWARMALADYRSVQLSKERPVGTDTDTEMRGALTWLPQLMKTHHPIIDTVDFVRLATTVKDVSKDSTTLGIFGFCSSVHALSQKQNPHPSDWEDARTKLMPFLQLSPKSGDLCAVANVVVGILYIELLRAIEQNTIRDPSLARKHHLPPSPYSFPFPELMILPPPFSSETIASFSTAHIQAMTKFEFLEDGEWVGYYSYSFGLDRVQFDSAMHRIFFKSAEKPQRSSLTLSAKGIDAIGDFGLTGEIDQQSGMITMVKRYNDNTSWRWKAVMTPFGIVGHWGRSGWGGWLWLWKASWNEE